MGYPAAGAPAAGDADARLLEWEIILPDRNDMDELLARLEAAGVGVTRDGEAIIARDPWGTAVRIRS